MIGLSLSLTRFLSLNICQWTPFLWYRHANRLMFWSKCVFLVVVVLT